MNCRDLRTHLDDYLDGELRPRVSAACESHLATCDDCRATLEAMRELRRATAQLPARIMPARDLWPGIHEQIASGAVRARTSPQRRTWSQSRFAVPPWLAPLSAAAAIVLSAWLAPRQTGAPAAWDVAAVAGEPRIGAARVAGEGRLRVGQWLETDANSRARVTVGRIGTVSVGPNSRLRLAGAAADEHRLELSRGSLHAFITAPPRIFFVDTPSATAIDLGCAYTLDVNAAGDGELRVELGYVALEHRGREAIIPAGLVCRTRKGAGPGTPFAADAPAELRAALERFDFGPAPAAALRDILAHARAADTITLWHVLARTHGAARGEVYDALAPFAPPPAHVTRAGVVARDPAMLNAWSAQLGLSPFNRW